MLTAIKKYIKANPSRKWLEDFVRRAAQNAAPDALVLDAGAGEGYYRSLFKTARYQATDLCKVEKGYGRIHFISDLSRIPICDEAYDMIICTQVLEHVPEPGQVLGEFFRILKPGGQLWFSVPFFFPEHEIPYDFFRYTRYGLSHLLTVRGFAVKELDWLEGYSGSLAFQCRVAARSLPLNPSAYGGGLLAPFFILGNLFLKPFFFLLSLYFNYLETRKKFTGAGYGKNFCGVAVKPAHKT